MKTKDIQRLIQAELDILESAQTNNRKSRRLEKTAQIEDTTEKPGVRDESTQIQAVFKESSAVKPKVEKRLPNKRPGKDSTNYIDREDIHLKKPPKPVISSGSKPTPSIPQSTVSAKPEWQAIRSLTSDLEASIALEKRTKALESLATAARAEMMPKRRSRLIQDRKKKSLPKRLATPVSLPAKKYPLQVLDILPKSTLRRDADVSDAAESPVSTFFKLKDPQTSSRLRQLTDTRKPTSLRLATAVSLPGKESPPWVDISRKSTVRHDSDVSDASGSPVSPFMELREHPKNLKSHRPERITDALARKEKRQYQSAVVSESESSLDGRAATQLREPSAQRRREDVELVGFSLSSSLSSGAFEALADRVAQVMQLRFPLYPSNTMSTSLSNLKSLEELHQTRIERRQEEIKHLSATSRKDPKLSDNFIHDEPQLSENFIHDEPIIIHLQSIPVPDQLKFTEEKEIVNDHEEAFHRMDFTDIIEISRRNYVEQSADECDTRQQLQSEKDEDINVRTLCLSNKSSENIILGRDRFIQSSQLAGTETPNAESILRTI
ncbi:hypothetical protein BC829DRAFT_429252 [Chytridium lagenaria]|nr:hypothetical protein BC829DRAFT_429252 [Chytridium lagenaria]